MSYYYSKYMPLLDHNLLQRNLLVYLVEALEKDLFCVPRI